MQGRRHIHTFQLVYINYYIYNVWLCEECMHASVSLSLFFSFFLSFDGSETLIKINMIGFALHLTNVFFLPGTPVFLFTPCDVCNWKPSFFSKVSSTIIFVFLSWIHIPKLSMLSLSHSPSPPPLPPPPSSPFSVTLLFHFSFTSHNTHYITSVTCHCHANYLPNTDQAPTAQAPPPPPPPPR